MSERAWVSHAPLTIWPGLKPGRACARQGDGEAEQIRLAELHGGDERDGIADPRLDGIRGGAGGAADSGVVEGHDPPGRCQRVDQRGVLVVQVAAEVLEQDQRHRAVAAGVAVGVLDAVGGMHDLVRKLRVSLGYGSPRPCAG